MVDAGVTRVDYLRGNQAASLVGYRGTVIPPAAADSIGHLLRAWRERRHLTQMDLALDAGVSPRHLSFLETGRSRPTREMIFRLAGSLDVPLRDRNALLLAAGLAPAYTQHRDADPPMGVVNDAIERILSAHMPYPAVVIDAHWDLVAANPAVDALTDGAAAHLLEPPINVLRLTFHPQGVAPRIINFDEWRSSILDRLKHDMRRTGSAGLETLRDELRTYSSPTPTAEVRATPLFVPLRLRISGANLALFSTTTVFGTPNDVTVSELAIESFYPDDDATRKYFHDRYPPATPRA
jgi:transcriptional regulator with XRE-family HTH domain